MENLEENSEDKRHNGELNVLVNSLTAIIKFTVNWWLKQQTFNSGDWKVQDQGVGRSNVW